MGNNEILQYLIQLDASGAISSAKEFQAAVGNVKGMVSSASAENAKHSASLSQMAIAYLGPLASAVSFYAALKLGYETTQQISRGNLLVANSLEGRAAQHRHNLTGNRTNTQALLDFSFGQIGNI